MIINLTQHPATPEQKKAGVFDLQGPELELLKQLLTFETLPTLAIVDDRAQAIAELACFNGLGGEDAKEGFCVCGRRLVSGCDFCSQECAGEGDDPFPNSAMIGGAPYLMLFLHEALIQRGIDPLYAFSVRQSVEKAMPDGTVQKINIFAHAGFVGQITI